VADKIETGYKWWVRYVIVPLLGSGGVVAIVVALIANGPNTGVLVPTPSALAPITSNTDDPIHTVSPGLVPDTPPMLPATTTSIPQVPTTPEPAAGTVRALDINGVKMEFVYIPGGEFTMGSDSGDVNESPMHTVKLSGFWIGKTEVTNAQYRLFVEANGFQQEEFWTGLGLDVREDDDATFRQECRDNSQFNQPDKPVVCVSWFEAIAYMRWLAKETGENIHLPSEAEWEKAARGTGGYLYPWGNEYPNGTRLNYCDQNCDNDHMDESVSDGYRYTAPVGSFPAGASPYGVLDMAGNVWEWTRSQMGDYPYPGDAEGRALREYRFGYGGSRVTRGGSWAKGQDTVHASFRDSLNPQLAGSDQGFRLVILSNGPLTP
jgi:formylglycine-generating enzyme required for sulfatase activity